MSGAFAAAVADVRRHLREPSPSWRKVLRVLFRQRGLQGVLVYRLGQALRRRRRWIIAWPLLLPGWLIYLPLAMLMRHGYGVDLRLSADIGAGLYIGHFGGIEVANCRIGSRCSIAQQTRIVGSVSAQDVRIGDRVWIGAHSRICSPLSIGDGATVAAGSHLSRDVPATVLVAGNPARVTARDYDNSRLL